MALCRAVRWRSVKSLFSVTRTIPKSFSSRSLEDLWKDYHSEIEELPEQRALLSLQEFLDAQSEGNYMEILPPIPPSAGYRHTLTTEQWQITLDSALITFCLHVQARIAALCGQGFYTIGPCGEEWLASAAHALLPNDATALHYRHLGINVARQLQEGHSVSDILLARARGYTVSSQDPVTGGVHCSIGSETGNDYIVTSTLASQCPSAVGRALGYSLAKSQGRPVSFCTIGDGSVHNHHFLSAFSLARHARHKRIKCPTIFGISDNGLSISYDTAGYVHTLFANDPLVPLFQANGNDPVHVYDQTKQAVDYARTQQAPCVLLYHDLTRRFGHAATDRQFAYLSLEDIQSRAEVHVIERVLVQAVEVYQATTWSILRDRLTEIYKQTQEAFVKAAAEPKVTRQEMLDQVVAPAVAVPRQPCTTVLLEDGKGKREVMRKHMTRVISEVMEEDDSVVYIGEDVEHGGYYLVTEGMAQKLPGRVIDFPPDETSLLGAAMGFGQVGLTPIVEIPYAKYLDCGADMFYEIGVMHWLSKGQLPNGMIVRLQGFDRGLFGGNFHTHNALPHMPPGVDVVCYSNGSDYVRGFRHAIAQAKAGRVVVSVDCTNLLNLRHLYGKDRGWERVYPSVEESLLGFDDVLRYGTKGESAIVSYGNGIVTALQARKVLVDANVLQSEDEVDIIDCPYLSGVPAGLKESMGEYSRVLFADICKQGPGSNVLSSTITSLHQEELLPTQWDLVAASRTYNPLGNYSTFLNVDDIANAFKKLSKR